MNRLTCIETGAGLSSRELIDKQAVDGCTKITALIFEGDKIREEYQWGFHLIGYSQGGLIARWLFMKCDKVRPYVATISTNGSPNLGVEKIPSPTDFGPSKKEEGWSFKKVGLWFADAATSLTDYFAKMSTDGKFWSFTQYLYKKESNNTLKLTNFLKELNESPTVKYDQLELYNGILYLDERVVTPRSSSAFGIDYLENGWPSLTNIPNASRFGFDTLIKQKRLIFCAAQFHHLALTSAEYSDFHILTGDGCSAPKEGMPVAEVRALYKECSALKFKYNPLNNLKCTGTMARRLVI